MLRDEDFRVNELFVDKRSPELKLYVEEEAAKVRNQAIGVLGFVAPLLSIAGFLACSLLSEKP